MIDIKKFEKEPEVYKDLLARRGYNLDIETLMNLRKEIVDVLIQIENINKARKNNRNPEDGRVFNERLQELANIKKDLDLKWNNIVDLVPNVQALDAPLGKGDEDNVEVKVWEGNNQNVLNLRPMQVEDFDTENGAKIAGARFAVLKNNVVKNQRKLIGEALDFYGDLGYQEHYVPLLVHPEIMYGTGQYPKFKEDIFEVGEHFLIPTGEVPLTNLYKDQIIEFKDDKAIKLCTHTPCFRKEAGSAGKDTKGIIRQHQFEKVELVKICHPDFAKKEFEAMIEDVESFIRMLGIKYRIIELCTGDMSFAGHKAFDIEMFFKNDQRYREIASITWCTDFQARRMKTRYKENGKNNFVHTINGTGLAVGRVLEAVRQNYQ